MALAHLLLAFAVVCGIGQSGARYFYCEAMGLTPTDPCVHARDDGDSDRYGISLSDKHADCCEVVTLTTMPDAARAASPSVLPAAVVAIVPGSWFAEVPATPGARGTKRFLDRWRPPPRSASELRARLMVFLT